MQLNPRNFPDPQTSTRIFELLLSFTREYYNSASSTLVNESLTTKPVGWKFDASDFSL